MVRNKHEELKEIGIYCEIRLSGNTDKYRHSLFFAKCKECGKTVERTMYDLKNHNTICQHNSSMKENISNPKFISSIPKDNYYRRVYELWRAMLKRTKESYWQKHPTYQGTKVSDDWLDFGIFYNDIKYLDGYDVWLNGAGKRVMLDKDVLGNGAKLYSKGTCCFLTHTESNRDVIRRHPENLEKFMAGSKIAVEKQKRRVSAINKKTKEERKFQSIRECSRELGIPSSNIWMCISNDDKYKSHKSSKGWIFKEI